MMIGSENFELGKKTYLMGILNVTPDSFSDGGAFNSVDLAVKHAKQMENDGADIIDVGGESSRPGHVDVEEEEELRRVGPVLEALKSEVSLPISVDTQKVGVAKKAAELGAKIINNCGVYKDPEMARICKEYGMVYCITHNQEDGNYKNFLQECLAGLERDLEVALKAGLSADEVIIDPGIGFAKNTDQNLTVLRNLKKFKGFGCALMLGTSRKSFLGEILNLPVKQRDGATAATTAFAAAEGVDFVRVHDVVGNKRAAEIIDAIVRKY